MNTRIPLKRIDNGGGANHLNVGDILHKYTITNWCGEPYVDFTFNGYYGCLKLERFEQVAMSGPGPSLNGIVACDGVPLGGQPTQPAQAFDTFECAKCGQQRLSDPQISFVCNRQLNMQLCYPKVYTQSPVVIVQNQDCTCQTLLSGHHSGCPYPDSLSREPKQGDK